MTDVTIEVLENGPYIVEGLDEVIDYDGSKLAKPAGRKTIALCRCGASANKPFCDGAHHDIGFVGKHAVVEES